MFTLRVVIAAFFGLCCMAASAADFKYPTIKQSGKAIHDFVPKGWHILSTAKGDLNADKVADIAAVLEYDKDLNAKNGKSNEMNTHKPRIFIVVFQAKKGGYTLSVQDNTLIRLGDEGGMMGDPFQGISVNRGSVLIHEYGGSAGRWDIIARYRFQKNGWYLIGLTDEEFDTITGESTVYDFNLLTGKMSVTEDNKIEPTGKPKVTWKTPGKRTVTIGKFRTWFDNDWPKISYEGEG
ncbi:MAG: hypothetical protein ACYDCO_01265 [Armatimonadota bacterium]